MIAYRCPQCGHRAGKLSVFLPVRDLEKVEENLYFEAGEMDDFLWNTVVTQEKEQLSAQEGEMGESRRIFTPRYGLDD